MKEWYTETADFSKAHKSYPNEIGIGEKNTKMLHLTNLSLSSLPWDPTATVYEVGYAVCEVRKCLKIRKFSVCVLCG